MDIFDLHSGTTPVLISVPHSGLGVPDDIKARLSNEGLRLTDTDWHVDRLYAPLKALGVSMLVANYSRYVVDLNRPADGASLYPGQTTTSLCPTETFKGEALYLTGKEPDAGEITARVETHWQPYHKALREELDRIKSIHGRVVLWDAHSINNYLPRLFDGQLPDLNFGTNYGKSCPAELADDLLEIAQDHGDYSAVLNGRFKGGAITRGYGAPKDGVFAVQLEMAQDCYMDQETFAYDEAKASKVQVLLERLLRKLIN